MTLSYLSDKKDYIDEAKAIIIIPFLDKLERAHTLKAHTKLKVLIIVRLYNHMTIEPIVALGYLQSVIN